MTQRIRIMLRCFIPGSRIGHESTAATALPRIGCARPDAGKRIDEGNGEEDHLRKPDHDIEHNRQDQQHARWMATPEIDLLARPESPGAHHQKSGQTHQAQPWGRDPPCLNGDPPAKVHRGSQKARRGRNRHSNEILAIWPPWIARLRIVADVESSKPRGTCDGVQEAQECTRLRKMMVQLRID